MNTTLMLPRSGPLSYFDLVTSNSHCVRRLSTLMSSYSVSRISRQGKYCVFTLPRVLDAHVLGRKRAEIPVYSFTKHSRLETTTSIYSPHVLILEGIFALHDPRVLDLLDMKVCTFLDDTRALISDIPEGVL